MGKEFYTCEYCFKKYRPTRRRVQKFCCNSCKSKAHHAKNPKKKPITDELQQEGGVKVLDPATKTKIETVSLPGVGNATLGTLAADGLKSIFTSQENKPATKADIKKLTNKIIKRYHLIKNMAPDTNGALPYFDMETSTVVYSLWEL